MSFQGLEREELVQLAWAPGAALGAVAAPPPEALAALAEPTAWEHFVWQLLSLSGEYLFFIGATYIAVLLLQGRRWGWATAVFALAVVWLTFHLPVVLYLESLGADSFAETHDFDLDEALFWAQTLREAIQPDFSPKKFAAYLAVALLSFYSLRMAFLRRGLGPRSFVAAKLVLACSCIALAFHQTTATALAFYLDNTEKFQATAQRFRNPAPAAVPPQRPVDLVVYIGESTSVMNMSLYGYPRPTTPQLEALAAQDEGLVVFDHVFATHAHTSRSLLEALSFGLDPREAFLPITERRRVSVVDVLRAAGLQPRLISNQGVGGSWDQASSVIFRQSDNVFRARARQGRPAERGWDDEFFHDQLQALPPPGAPGQVLFLHSYAGHGPYLKNIPERFRRPVDDQLMRWPRRELLADPVPKLSQIDAYDSAMRYVDHSVSRMIDRVRHAARPTVMVYFSDHGDAVYAGLGHDSARFRHEMARVPFLVYFNEAARQQRPGLLAQYRQLAASHTPATLAQLPSTLLDLLGARLTPSAAPSVMLTPVIGQAVELPPIMVRQLAGGMSFVNLSGRTPPERTPSGQRVFDRTDPDTRRYVDTWVRRRTGIGGSACTLADATLEQLSREIMLTRCRPAPELLAQQRGP